VSNTVKSIVHNSQQGLDQRPRNLKSQTDPLAYTSDRRYLMHAISADVDCLALQDTVWHSRDAAPLPHLCTEFTCP